MVKQGPGLMRPVDVDFKRRFLKRLDEHQVEHVTNLASGLWAAPGTDALAISCEATRRVGYLRALQAVRDLLAQVEDEMKGE